MSAIKYDFDLADSETQIMQMDRWGYPAYSIGVSTGTALVEGTLQRINQGETPSWFALSDQAGVALATLTTFASIQDTTPIDSIRITAAGATTGSVIQTGA